MTERGLDPVRLARVVAALAPSDRDGDPQPSLCAASAKVMNVTGAGVVLILRGRTLGTVCYSDELTGSVEEVQYTLGEGPCVDAFASKAPVLVPDLDHLNATRWPGFREGALANGIRAVFGFPLLVGAVCIGALNLYNADIGDLTEDQMEDAVLVAHVAGRAVMSWQSVAGPGSLAWQLEHADAHRAVVNQAAGMVSVQADVGVEEALLLLRAYSFAEDRQITQVAADVVDRSLRFD
jgi:transcriptional regulator with GAF, ATPase, and Fis domain